MPVKLTPRLATAVDYIRPHARLADIGTDHAYLPIYLCETGILNPQGDGIPVAIAADINRGPVERAAAHIAAAGLSECIRTVQTDGLQGLEGDDPTDIIIFGMGGELIAAILESSPWARQPLLSPLLTDGVEYSSRRLILQPMTHAERLRAYLCEAGYTIVGETLSREGNRIYQTICAEGIALHAETPPACSMTPAELYVGRLCHHCGDEAQMTLCRLLVEKTLRTETSARAARARAGQNTDTADALLDSLTALQKEL